MDREIWKAVMSAVRKAARAVEAQGPRARRKPLYPNWLIVAMYLWGVWHDRCLSWCCDRGHYGALFRPRVLPSVSQFTRRVKTDECQAILQRVHEDLAARGVAAAAAPGALSYVDGKPLPVGPASKDPDAARGKVSGGYAKGYKLHAYVNENRRVAVWSVMPLNTDEKLVAEEMLPHVCRAGRYAPDPLRSLALADSNYDSAPLYKRFGACGQALLTPLRAQQSVGPDGHSPQTLRKMGPQRREAVRVWDERPGLAGYVLEQRNNAEGVFSVLTVACGLDRLPAAVRRLHRVRRWVGGKIILYHARLLAQERAAGKAVA